MSALLLLPKPALSSDLEVLREKRASLLLACKSTRLPHPGTIRSFGKDLPLPLRFTESSVERKRTLKSLFPRFVGSDRKLYSRSLQLVAMHFAMHGCVRITKKSGGYYLPTLRSFKCSQAGSILHLIGLQLGGTVGVHTRSHHLLLQPKAMWHVNGKKALKGAATLAQFASPVQRKLKMLEEWPASQGEREDFRKTFDATEWDRSNPLEISCIEDAALFFDVCGSIQLRGWSMTNVGVSMSCPSSTEYDQLSEVLKDHFGRSMEVGMYRRPGTKRGRFEGQLYIKGEKNARDVLAVFRDSSFLKTEEIDTALSLPDGLSWWYSGGKTCLGNVARSDAEYRNLRKRSRILSKRKLRAPTEDQVGGGEDEEERTNYEKQKKKLELQIQYLDQVLKRAGP